MYTYVRQTKLTDICGRADYITNKTKKHEEEDIVLVGGSVSDWRPYAQYEQKHRRSDKPNNEGRELIVALPNSWAKLPAPILKSLVDDLAKKLIRKKSDYQFAVHWNKAHTNLHVHIIFSEREFIHTAPSQPRSGDFYDRDVFYTAEGKIARKSSERARNERGEVLPPVHRKGELKEKTSFTPKNKLYKSKTWLNDVKEEVSKHWASPLVPDKKHVTNYLHTLHLGKSPRAAEVARSANERIRQINQWIDELKAEGYKFGNKEFHKQLVFWCYQSNGCADKQLSPNPLLHKEEFQRDIVGFASNYEEIEARKAKIQARSDRQAQKLTEKKDQERNLAERYISQYVNDKMLWALDTAHFNYDYAQSLKEFITERLPEADKKTERAVKRMTIDKAREILGNRFVPVIEEQLERYRGENHDTRSYDSVFDQAARSLNALHGCSVPTNGDIREQAEKKKREQERIQRLRREQEQRQAQSIRRETAEDILRRSKPSQDWIEDDIDEQSRSSSHGAR